MYGLKLKKINCGILWLIFGLMETIMILVYAISHCYISIKTNDTKTIVVPLIFLLTGIINIISWFLVYQYVKFLSKQKHQVLNTFGEGRDNQNQLQIRCNTDGRIDILQDMRGLSPGVYAIAPVHNKNGTSSATTMRNNGIHNTLMVYPSPESGILIALFVMDSTKI